MFSYGFGIDADFYVGFNLIFGAVLVFIRILIGFEGLVTCQHYLIICCFGVFVWFLGEMRGSFAINFGCCHQPGCTLIYDCFEQAYFCAN